MLNKLFNLPLLTQALVVLAWFAAGSVISLAIVAWALVRMPADYFLHDRPLLALAGWPRPLRWAVRIMKNLVGLGLVVMGLVMLVTPGQGVLTILIGVMLLEFPGKRGLECKLIARPRLLRAINRLRARFGRPALVVPP